MRLPRPSMIRPYLAIHASPYVVRARMAATLPRLARRRDPAARAVAAALAATARSRTEPAERDWIERIEGWRAVLSARQTRTRAGIEPEPGGLPEWAPGFDRPIEIGGAAFMLSIPPDWGLFLFHLVRALRPRSCLELGTAFGVSTAFQAAALELNGEGQAITMDAAREWARTANEGWERLGLRDRIDMRLGQIDGRLPEALAAAGPLDFAFIDAEHQVEPTLGYLEAMLPHLSDRAVVVWDDINFPRQMREAWAAIKAHPRVDLALGIGRMGVTTFR